MQIHESPWIMIVPMVILAFVSAFGGYIGLPAGLGVGNAIEDFLQPVFADSAVALPATESVTTEAALIAVSVLAVGIGFLAAYWIYIRHWGLAGRMTKGARWLYDVVYHGYYVDEAYTEGIVKPLWTLGDLLDGTVEVRGIDAALYGLARLVRLSGEALRRLQTGLVRNYALALLAGVVALLAYFIVRGVLGW